MSLSYKEGKKGTRLSSFQYQAAQLEKVSRTARTHRNAFPGLNLNVQWPTNWEASQHVSRKGKHTLMKWRVEQQGISATHLTGKRSRSQRCTKSAYGSLTWWTYSSTNICTGPFGTENITEAECPAGALAVYIWLPWKHSLQGSQHLLTAVSKQYLWQTALSMPSRAGCLAAKQVPRSHRNTKACAGTKHVKTQSY